MQTKLTLCLDQQLIQKAKRWAKARNLSLSEAVANFFRQLPDPEQPVELSPWTRSLIGVLSLEEVDANREALRDTCLNYLEKKYE